ncbi:HNH endonuclease domain-containing protein [Pseudomonas sichuanensis]|uniref:HNH endonuclease domain-containing protein n=1 Tax=Pseudomonas sichuanensis TaxID=2213015 RepID=UPI002ACB0C1C|nr:HNH endonuclease domain-containing protein [Pseudomonas sichuanensis]
MPTALSQIDQKNHESLKELGAGDNKFWNTKHSDHAALVATFRSEVKRYYWERQSRRCCYCSKELDESKAAYDAEHIIPKNIFPQFMFDLANLSVACKTCNGVKKNKSVLSSKLLKKEVPRLSSDYTIVHPHLDEWGDYFSYDSIRRIISLDSDGKGAKTIEMCGINYLNAARLADYFLPADYSDIQSALEGFFRVKSRGWKLKYLDILEGLVVDLNYEPARNILGALRDEI